MHERPALSPALIGWAGIAALVIGYDTWALLTGKETLSSCYDRLSRTRRGRLLVNGGWTALTWHLWRLRAPLLPEPYHARYRQIHPLWRLHDRAVTRANIRIVADPLIAVRDIGTNS